MENSCSDLIDTINRIEKSNESIDARMSAIHKLIQKIEEPEKNILIPIRRINNNIILLQQMNK